MESSIFVYFIKVSVSLAVFYGIYMLFLKKDTFLKIRRFYFLFAITFSALYPTFSIELSAVQDEAQVPIYWLSEITLMPTADTHQESSETYALQNILPLLLAATSVFLLLKLLFQLLSIVRLRLANKKVSVGRQQIVEIEEVNFSPFSFFGWVFINPTDANVSKLNEILAHEQVHIRQFHSIDVLIAELLCICLWWNPIVWLMKKEMKINLEYLADKGVIDEGFDVKIYQYALLQVSCNNTGIPIINNFNVSQLKKRIAMMNKEKTSLLKSVKYLLILPISAALLLGNAVQAAPELISNTMQTVPIVESVTSDAPVLQDKGGVVFAMVEKMPAYVGGETKMMQFISDNMNYPADAVKEGMQGQVTVRFTVRKDGRLDDVKVLRGISPVCDAEAIRLIKSMPNWIAGEQNGAKVDCYFTLPVIFKLNKK